MRHFLGVHEPLWNVRINGNVLLKESSRIDGRNWSIYSTFLGVASNHGNILEGPFMSFLTPVKRHLTDASKGIFTKTRRLITN